MRESVITGSYNLVAPAYQVLINIIFPVMFLGYIASWFMHELYHSWDKCVFVKKISQNKL